MNKITIIDDVSYQELLQKIEEIDRKVLAIKAEKPANRWLTNKEVSEMLSVTGRTLQNYRDSGILPFSQVGTKIYYRESDIESFLQDHYQDIHNSALPTRRDIYAYKRMQERYSTRLLIRQKGGKRNA